MYGYLVLNTRYPYKIRDKRIDLATLSHEVHIHTLCKMT